MLFNRDFGLVHVANSNPNGVKEQLRRGSQTIGDWQRKEKVNDHAVDGTWAKGRS
jgi:hypothetical protein